MASSRTAVVTLPSDTQILVIREFAAPKHLVYKAWTTPELIRSWWSAKRGEVTVADVDLKPGGRWRYAMTTGKGFEVAFHGEYREVVPNERLVYTEVYEGAPDAPAVTTVTFAEQDGRTTVTILADHASKAARDAVIATGMEDGLQDALDLLEEAAIALSSR
ncbi:MAG: SRPBCC family protein [Gemmatimonadales bacterium]